MTTDTTITEIPASTTPADAAVAPVGGTTAVAAAPNSEAATVAGAGEGQGEAAKAGEGEGAAAADTEPKAADGPPEQYEPFTLPEGWALEGDRLAAVHEYAKAKGWTQADAQDNVAKFAEFREAEREAERGALALAAREEFGTDFEAIAAGSQHGIALVEKSRPGATQRLAETNLGNHPDFLFVLNLLSKAVREPDLPGLTQPIGSRPARSEGDRAYSYADKPDKRRG